MKQFEKRLRALESAAGVGAPKPWRRVIVDIGETKEEVFAREGIGPDDNVIVRRIVAPSGWRAETDSQLRAQLRAGGGHTLH